MPRKKKETGLADAAGQKDLEMKDVPLGRRKNITRAFVEWTTSKLKVTTKPDKAEEIAELGEVEIEAWVREKAKRITKCDKGEYDKHIDILIDMIRRPANYPKEDESV